MSSNNASSDSHPPPKNAALLDNNKTKLGSFCLTKQRRIKTPADFQRVYSSKQWGGSKHFTFNVLANDIDQQNSLGVTASKKVSKRAVDRNHLKRLMREFFRLRQSELKGVNLVLTAKPSSRHVDNAERLESLEVLWAKVLKWQRWHSRELIKSRELSNNRETTQSADLNKDQDLGRSNPT